ncbi:hypothetical protein ASE25_22055 [Terrabacter sp. Root85]|jgi:hypothetical protein|uniref:hypothetical protein n=1 Tax=unclassified Terrabacter TaxID=2630222 RepID=UPI0006F4FEE2|nr:hypothetical protein [Terrabacter sp. Root85]KRC91041.1 hypothetical protein ASE25_22055 [Terrabacter sp. Root85]
MDLSLASEAQAAEIRDNKVDASEYRAAFQRFRECLSAAGYELGQVELKHAMYEFAMPDAAVQSGAEKKCYHAEFNFVDILWQTSDGVQNGSQETQHLRDCLRKRGVEPGDTRAKVDMQMREEGVTLRDCFR